MAARIGCTGRRLDEWVIQAERDTGRRLGPTTEMQARLDAPERENRALRQANGILRKPKDEPGFAVHARRLVVGRCFARPGRDRRRARDVEASTTFPCPASVSRLARRVARYG
jgi:hypothetical protein